MRHLCDANVLLALAVGQHAHHAVAARWFRDLGEGDTVAFCRATQMTFLRLLTRKISGSYTPITNRQAWGVYDALRRDEAVVFLDEPSDLEVVWRKLANPTTASPKIWMDAYLAAFAVRGRLRMVTLDMDFRRFQSHGLDLHLLGA